MLTEWEEEGGRHDDSGTARGHAHYHHISHPSSHTPTSALQPGVRVYCDDVINITGVATPTYSRVNGRVFDVCSKDSRRGNTDCDAFVKPAIMDISMEQEVGLFLYILEMRERRRRRG